MLQRPCSLCAQTVPTLIRLSKATSRNDVAVRTSAGCALAALIRHDRHLQEVAFITDHCVRTYAQFLRDAADAEDVSKVWRNADAESRWHRASCEYGPRPPAVNGASAEVRTAIIIVDTMHWVKRARRIACPVLWG